MAFVAAVLFAIAVPALAIGNESILAQIATQIELIRIQIEALKQRILTSQQSSTVECDAFSGGFTPKQPLFGSASVTSNTGNSVSISFSSCGPTPLLPGIMADMATAEGITNSRAKRLCEKEKWNDQPCELEDTYPDGVDIGVGNFPANIDLGLFTSCVSGTAVYTCKCKTTTTPGSASTGTTNFTDKENVGFYDGAGVTVRDSSGKIVFTSSFEYFMEEIFSTLPGLETAHDIYRNLIP